MGPNLTVKQHWKRGFLGFILVCTVLVGSVLVLMIPLTFLFMTAVAVFGDSAQLENYLYLAIIACTILLAPCVLSAIWENLAEIMESFRRHLKLEP